MENHSLGGGGGNDVSCFAAGSSVLLGGGEATAIERVCAGDLVLGFDGIHQAVAQVIAIEAPIRSHMSELHFDDGSRLYLTREHPLMTADGWCSIDPSETNLEIPGFSVGILGVGSRVFNAACGHRVVTACETNGRRAQAYNLILAPPFTSYYVNAHLAHCKLSTTSLLREAGRAA